MSTDGALADRLRSHWPLPAALGLRERLLTAYAEPHRGYHDLRHLADVLDQVEQLRADGVPVAEHDLLPVRLAAWFHDAVYDDRGDLEERSAELADHELRAVGLEGATVAETARLVRLTAGHRAAPEDSAGAVLCDADLAVLAADPERYADYVAGVRAEYAFLDDGTFARGRASVLRALLEGPLFHTEAARARWERRGRANVEDEIARLGG